MGERDFGHGKTPSGQETALGTAFAPRANASSLSGIRAAFAASASRMAVRKVSRGTGASPPGAPRARRRSSRRTSPAPGDAGERHPDRSTPCRRSGEVLDHGAVEQDGSARRDVGPNFARLGALNATSTCGSGDAGESTSSVRHVDVGVRGSAARFRPVARDVRRVEPLVDRAPRDEHGGGLRAVAPGAGQLERTSSGSRWHREAVANRSAGPRGAGGASSTAPPRRPAGRIRNQDSGADVLLHPERKHRLHRVPGPTPPPLRGRAPRWGGHSDSTSTNANPGPSTCSSSAFWIAFLARARRLLSYSATRST